MATTPASVPAVPAAAAAPAQAASLYVGDLKPEVVEQHLFDHFSTVGNVKSVLVCREHHTRRSLCYGYVNFHRVEDAERALETLNYQPILGQNVRISWSQRDPEQRRRGIGNLFVKDLELDVDEKKLLDTFSYIGPISSVRIMRNKEGKSLGHGFVQFERVEDSQRAMLELNGKPIGPSSKNITVVNFISKSNRPPTVPTHFTNLYVKYLDPSWKDEASFTAFFAQFGEVTSVFLPRKETGELRGYGFVNFKNAEMAKKAMEEAGKKEVGEGENKRTLYVGQAVPKAQRAAELKAVFERRAKCNLYVKELEGTVNEVMLKNHFGSAGTVASVKIVRDETTGRSKGFGFVCMSTPEEAQHAITTLHGTPFAGRTLYVAPHQRKEERQRYLEQWRATQAGAAGWAGMPAGAAGLAGMRPPMMPYMMNPAMNPMMQQLFLQQMMMGSMNPGANAAAGRPAWAQMPMVRGGFPGFQYGMPAQPSQYPGRRGGMVRTQGAPSRLPAGAGAAAQQQQAAKAAAMAGPSASRVYQPHVRNIPEEKPQQVVVPGVPAPAQARFPAGELNPAQALLEKVRALSPADQKQQIGEYLFLQVSQLDPEHAGKITGMLLEMDLTEIIALIEAPQELEAKIHEAHSVLLEAGADQPAQ